jgi:hypothetical protein
MVHAGLVIEKVSATLKLEFRSQDFQRGTKNLFLLFGLIQGLPLGSVHVSSKEHENVNNLRLNTVRDEDGSKNATTL